MKGHTYWARSLSYSHSLASIKCDVGKALIRCLEAHFRFSRGTDSLQPLLNGTPRHLRNTSRPSWRKSGKEALRYRIIKIFQMRSRCGRKGSVALMQHFLGMNVQKQQREYHPDGHLTSLVWHKHELRATSKSPTATEHRKHYGILRKGYGSIETDQRGPYQSQVSPWSKFRHQMRRIDLLPGILDDHEKGMFSQP